jgi:hypothetical protein
MCALKNVHGLTFDQISKIAGPYVKAKMRKIANKQAKKTAKKQQAQNQAKNQTQNQAQKQSAGSRQVILFETDIF